MYSNNTKVGSLNKPKIGVSSCLLGHLVRYDGREKSHPAISLLPSQFELIALCPEVGVGLSVPRPPVQLVKLNNGLSALGVENRELDVTSLLNSYLQSQLHIIRSLSGMILKTRSPSCGIDTTPLFNPNGEGSGYSSGLFTAGIQQQFPSLPLIDEEMLGEQLQRDTFFQEVHRYHVRDNQS
jgi:uncharacterized protein YbbK (DUF523 family)